MIRKMLGIASEMGEKLQPVFFQKHIYALKLNLTSESKSKNT